MLSRGHKSLYPCKIIEDRLNEVLVLNKYFNIYKLPCLIKSPLRVDNHPSFGLYTKDGVHVLYTDFSTQNKGNIYCLLSKLWNMPYNETVNKVYKELTFDFYQEIDVDKTNKINKSNSDSKLECTVREWKDYDIEYWKSFGISLEWLKFGDVYPISHKIVTKGDDVYTFTADKYAYAYVEHKEGNTTLKIYQPFNDKGFKWSNKHDSSTISLWSKLPEKGESVCICSSLKDALCLWSNIGIPSIAIQGEGYSMSNTAINQLKSRFNRVFICLDNDEPGIIDAQKLSKKTGFINIVLPKFDGGKDISDFYKIYGKDLFIEKLKSLFMKYM